MTAIIFCKVVCLVGSNVLDAYYVLEVSVSTYLKAAKEGSHS